MNKALLISLFVALAIAAISCQDPNPQELNHEIYHGILDAFTLKGDVKQLFKVWHYINNKEKEYSLNSETALSKYRKFKTNLGLIQRHNAKNLSWKEGLNQYSDMDEREMDEYLGVRDRTEEELKDMVKELTGKFDFDSYVDVDEKTHPKADRTPVDWTSVLAPARNQKSCGSCYAFSAEASIEGNYVINRRAEGKMLEETILLSTQQIVDCDYSNSMCSGGGAKRAVNYIIREGIMLDQDYPYIAEPNYCQINHDKLSDVKVTGMELAEKVDAAKEDQVYTLLKKGPLSNCVDTTNLHRYKSGIATFACTKRCTHAVNTIGWGVDESTGMAYLKMRNSWGAKWGESGYARIAQNYANGFSCMLEHQSYSLRAIVN